MLKTYRLSLWLLSTAAAVAPASAYALDRHSGTAAPSVEIHLEALAPLRAAAQMQPVLSPEAPISAQPVEKLVWQKGPEGKPLPPEEKKQVAQVPPAPTPKAKKAPEPKVAKVSPPPKVKARPEPKVEVAAPAPPPPAPPPPKMAAAEPPPPPPPPPPAPVKKVVKAEPPPPLPPAVEKVAKVEEPVPPPAPAVENVVKAEEPPPPPPIVQKAEQHPEKEELLGQMSEPVPLKEKKTEPKVEVAKAEALPVVENIAPPPPPPAPPPPPPPAPPAPEASPPPVSLTPPPPPAVAEPKPQPGSQQVASIAPPPPAATEKSGPVDMTLAFPANETAVPDAAKKQLDALAEKLKKDGTLRLSVVSHASGDGDQASTARRVSLARALAVRAHLIDQGVDNLRINVQAEGSKNAGDNPDRVDIVVMTPVKG